MKRIFLYGLGGILIAALGLGAYVFRNLAASGQFSTLRPENLGSCTQIPFLVGVEDLVIDRVSGFVFYSSDDRRDFMAGGKASGGIYLGSYDRPEIAPQLLTGNVSAPFHPHGISLYTAPDGAKTLGVINHPTLGTANVLLFDIVEDRPNGGAPVISLRLRRTVGDLLFSSFNDLHLIGHDRFYASNDLGSQSSFGKTLEYLFFLPRARVVYFDGSTPKVAAEGLVYSNGINQSPDGSMIYVAETSGLSLRIYARDAATGALTPKEQIAFGAALDNIDVDEQGRLWIAAHPHVLDFLFHVGDASKLSPSQIIRVTPKASEGGDVRQVYLNLGGEISAASVAAYHKGRMIVGSVFERKYLNCAMPE
jgi:arylesterase/paraoxonase